MGAARFDTLDGLRGIAAVAVIGHHAPGFFADSPRFAGGHLSVDLFFAISGFVLCAAYGRKFDGGLGAADFMRARFTRLYPLYIAGTALCLLALVPTFIRGDFAKALSLPFALFMLPDIPSMLRGEALYPLNPPTWSLFYELVINLVLVLAWRRLSVVALTVLVGLSLVPLVALSFQHGSLDPGVLGSDAAVALARVTFSFFLGVLIFRSGIYLKAPVLPGWILAPAFLLCLVPAVAWRGVFDVAIVALVFPVILTLGAQAKASGAWLRTCVVGGVTSYALYMLHIPMLWFAKPLFTRFGIVPDLTATVVFVIVAVAGSWVAHTYFDEPLRLLLAKRRGSLRRSPEPSTPR